MAHPEHESALRVADLFRMRNADRLGLTVSDADRARDADINAFGEGLGIAPRAGGATTAPAMPGQPVTSGAAVPAGDALGGMAPPGGGQPTGQTDAMRSRAAPATPSAAASGGMSGSGIPALDALAGQPAKRSRGLYHNRKLGRVLGGGS